MLERGPVDPGTLRFPDEVEALVGLGKIERADALLDPFERRRRRLGRPWALGAAARCRGLSLASRRQLESAVKEFNVAIQRQRDLEQPLELGRTYLAQGIAPRRWKKWGPARDSLNGAARIFERLGARTWSRRTTAELNRLGGRAPNLDPPARVSQARRQVAYGTFTPTLERSGLRRPNQGLTRSRGGFTTPNVSH